MQPSVSEPRGVCPATLQQAPRLEAGRQQLTGSARIFPLPEKRVFSSGSGVTGMKPEASWAPPSLLRTQDKPQRSGERSRALSARLGNPAPAGCERSPPIAAIGRQAEQPARRSRASSPPYARENSSPREAPPHGSDRPAWRLLRLRARAATALKPPR